MTYLAASMFLSIGYASIVAGILILGVSP